MRYTAPIKALSIMLLSGAISSYAVAENQQDRVPNQGNRGAVQQPDTSRARMRMEGGGVNRDAQASIRGTLGSIVENALSGDFESVSDNFAEQDQNRAGKDLDTEMSNASALARDIKYEWQRKYSSSFDWDSDDSLQQALKDAHIMVSPDQRTAQVHLPASHGLPETTVALRNEGTVMNAWKIDVPDAKDGNMVRQNLENELKQIQATKATWPNDQNMAAGAIAHRILMVFSMNTGQSS